MAKSTTHLQNVLQHLLHAPVHYNFNSCCTTANFNFFRAMINLLITTVGHWKSPFQGSSFLLDCKSPTSGTLHIDVESSRDITSSQNVSVVSIGLRLVGLYWFGLTSGEFKSIFGVIDVFGSVPIIFTCFHEYGYIIAI